MSRIDVYATLFDLFADRRLSKPAVHLMVGLISYAHGKPDVWPSNDTLASVAGISQRQLKRLLKELRDSEWIQGGDCPYRRNSPITIRFRVPSRDIPGQTQCTGHCTTGDISGSTGDIPGQTQCTDQCTTGVVARHQFGNLVTFQGQLVSRHDTKFGATGDISGQTGDILGSTGDISGQTGDAPRHLELRKNSERTQKEHACRTHAHARAREAEPGYSSHRQSIPPDTLDGPDQPRRSLEDQALVDQAIATVAANLNLTQWAGHMRRFADHHRHLEGWRFVVAADRAVVAQSVRSWRFIEACVVNATREEYERIHPATREAGNDATGHDTRVVRLPPGVKRTRVHDHPEAWRFPELWNRPAILSARIATYVSSQRRLENSS